MLAPQRVEDRGVKVMQPGSRRVDLERLRTRLLSLRHLPALSQQYGQVLVGRNVTGRKGDDSACSGYRFLAPSEPAQAAQQDFPGRSLVGEILRQSSCEQLGFLELSLPKERNEAA